jgi:uncharacterized iron-regulated protein
MRTLITIILLALSTITFAGKHYSSYKIYTSKGKEVSFEKVIKAVEGKSHVFMGEYHNNAISHWLQLEMMNALYEMYKKNLVMGAEMFEADNQYILDEYLSGQISSKNYQNEMRLWPNYNTDYKPLVEFAKENELKFIATNIPRRYANMVYKKGIESLKGLSELAKSYIVPLNEFKFDSTITCYADIYQMSHGGEGMATAQAIKDATMSYFILQNSTPNTVFLHFQGTYHSDKYQGIVHYLKKKIALDKILTVSTVTQESIDELLEENLGLADFIICVKENVTSTH